jgi:AraC-like DNA-binding protein
VRPSPGRVGPFRNVGGEAESHTATSSGTRLDDWRDMLREHFVALDVADPVTDATFDSAVRSTLVGHVSAAVVSSMPQSCARTAGLVRDDPHAYLQVGLLARGRAVVEQDGREAVLTPGQFVIYETTRPFSWHFPDRWTLLVLTWPRHLVDLDEAESRSATARALGQNRLGGIVGRTLAETALQPPELADDDGRRVAGELSALVGMTLGDHSDDGLSLAGAADLRRRVACYVADHAEDPQLSVEQIANQHYVSVRGLHRAFADTEMTVGALIRRLRLAHARQRLVDPRSGHLSITEIAHACGFADLPTFSHVFKLQYHESPSSYRRRLPIPESVTA